MSEYTASGRYELGGAYHTLAAVSHRDTVQLGAAADCRVIVAASDKLALVLGQGENGPVQAGLERAPRLAVGVQQGDVVHSGRADGDKVATHVHMATPLIQHTHFTVGLL